MKEFFPFLVIAAFWACLIVEAAALLGEIIERRRARRAYRLAVRFLGRSA